MKKSKKIPNHFIIKLELYPFDIMVSIQEPDVILFNRLRLYGNTLEDCGPLLNLSNVQQGVTYLLPSNTLVIRLVLCLDKYKMMGTITHEVFHAVSFMLSRIGMKPKLLVSDEAYANWETIEQILDDMGLFDKQLDIDFKKE